MFEKVAWFTIIYVCFSITVTLLMIIFANKVFRLGGTLGMARSLCLLVLALIGLITYGIKKASGSSDSNLTADEQIKKTIRKTSAWFDKLKKEWEDGKK